MDASTSDVTNAGPLPEALAGVSRDTLDKDLETLGRATRSGESYDFGIDEGVMPVMDQLNIQPILQTNQLGLTSDNLRRSDNASAIFGRVPDFGSSRDVRESAQEPLLPLVPRSNRGRQTGDKTFLKRNSMPTPPVPKGRKKEKETKKDIVFEKSDSSCSGDFVRDFDSQLELFRKEMILEFQQALDKAHPGSKLVIIDGKMVISSIKEERKSQSSLVDQETVETIEEVKKEIILKPECSPSEETICQDLCAHEDLTVSIKSVVKNKIVKITLTDYTQVGDDPDDLMTPFKRYLKDKNLIKKAHILYDLKTIKKLIPEL